MTEKEIVAIESLGESPEYFDHYISGFVDGEGCFSVSFREWARLKCKIELRPSFSVGQKKSAINLRLLQKIQQRFKGGTIRFDSAGKGLYKYETRSLCHIVESVVPFFERYPLYTEKGTDFAYFCKICDMMKEKKHLTRQGLLDSIAIAEKMNLSGKRRVAFNDLRALLTRSVIE